MRKEATHRSEMTSQLLFGEYVEILEEEEQFVRVKCLYDEYEGWVQKNQLTITNKVVPVETYVADWSGEVLVNGSSLNIPMCSPVYSSKENTLKLDNLEIQYLKKGKESHWNTNEKVPDKALLEKIYKTFLNTPYLWGGKSVYGIDCSGFVQQVFKMFGIKLLRDAYLQAEQGTLVNDLDENKLGDLAFFQNEKGRVTHVGIILENHEIVHASGKVRIDTIDEKGIVNKETGERTHQIHSMKTYF